MSYKSRVSTWDEIERQTRLAQEDELIDSILNTEEPVRKFKTIAELEEYEDSFSVMEQDECLDYLARTISA